VLQRSSSIHLDQLQLHTTTAMEPGDQLDADVSDLRARIATLQAHRANLASVLLSQPHLAARLNSAQPAKRLIDQQSRRNLENVYRACAGVTAYKVQDPDPNAVNKGNILGISIDVAVSGRFVTTYHVLFSFHRRESSNALRIHKHTIPPCIPLQQLANKWLPVNTKDGDDAIDPEQDLVRFGRTLRKELVSWHMRLQAVEHLQKEAGVLSVQSDKSSKRVDSGPMGKVLNAFVSDSESDEEDVSDRMVDIDSDAAARQITVAWSNGRTAVMSVSKDGRVERASCRTRDGVRDVALARKAIGSLGGLVRRLRDEQD
jgi:central kinetochore subunit Mal2/MCM21